MKKSKRFVRRLFQAAVEIIKKKSPKASFVDFHGCGSFHQLPLPQISFFLLLFLSLLPTGISRPGTHPGISELEDRFELLIDLSR